MKDFNSQNVANSCLKMAKSSGMKDFTSQELASTSFQKVALNDFNSQENAGFDVQKLASTCEGASPISFDAITETNDYNSQKLAAKPSPVLYDANICDSYTAEVKDFYSRDCHQDAGHASSLVFNASHA
eukprot:6890382-Karenia_brevis.AAC.1